MGSVAVFAEGVHVNFYIGYDMVGEEIVVDGFFYAVEPVRDDCAIFRKTAEQLVSILLSDDVLTCSGKLSELGFMESREHFRACVDIFDLDGFHNISLMMHII